MATDELANSIVSCLNIGVIVFSGAAGVAWLTSSLAAVTADEDDGGGFTMTVGDEGVRVVVDGLDLNKTMAKQAKWNKWAAASACVAAFFQALQAAPWAKIVGI